MSVFSEDERAYLEQPGHLGRLATVAADGTPHVVPLGWRYNPELDTIDVGGRDAAEFVASVKFRHVRANPRVGFVVDDVLPPWRPRCVTIRGRAEAIDTTDGDGRRVALIRITPEKVVSWGVPDGD
ncbi:MAG TPA: PPOX class F420-dependent oxidoreductase [Acidimicrobiales bacterium]|jgi:pyridoxamine 5'-phosphate oxidase family protein